MNFLPCRLEEADGALRVRLTDEIALPVPADAHRALQAACRTRRR